MPQAPSDNAPYIPDPTGPGSSDDDEEDDKGTKGNEGTRALMIAKAVRPSSRQAHRTRTLVMTMMPAAVRRTVTMAPTRLQLQPRLTAATIPTVVAVIPIRMLGPILPRTATMTAAAITLHPMPRVQTVARLAPRMDPAIATAPTQREWQCRHRWRRRRRRRS